MPSFDFFDNLVFDANGVQKERIRGIMNGGFDRIGSSLLAPGWIEHGGEKSNYPPNNVTFQTGFATLNYSPNSEESVFLRHNRCYVPNDATAIVFSVSPHNLRAGVLMVVVVDAGAQNITDSTSFVLDESSVGTMELRASLASSAGRVVTFEFRFRGIPINVDINPMLQISKVALSAESVYVNTALREENLNIQSLDEADRSPAASIDLNSEDVKVVQNDLTVSVNNWERISGEVSFSDELITLDAINRRGECKVVSLPFLVTEENRTVDVSVTPVGTMMSKFRVYIQTDNNSILAEEIDIKSYPMDDFENTLEQLGGGEGKEREAEQITIDLSSLINDEVQIVLELVHKYGRSKVVKLGIN